MNNKSNSSILSLLTPYRGLVVLLIALTMLANGLALYIPRIIAGAIDSFTFHQYNFQVFLITFLSVILGIFIITILQNIVQVVTSERVARDLRTSLMGAVSNHDYMFIQEQTSAKLLTNAISDVDAVKMFVSQAVPSIVSSIFLVVGASTLMLTTNLRLGLAVITIIPIIGVMFFFVMRRVRTLFKIGQEAIDWLNKVIQESIIASVLIRLLNARQFENEKFVLASTQAKTISMNILKMFATVIPVITFVNNIAILIILVLGGQFVIGGTMTLGDFTAFNNYLAILIFPIVILGFTTNLIAMSSASYERIKAVLYAPQKDITGNMQATLRGEVAVDNLSLAYGTNTVLSAISFTASASKKTAIVGPSAGGKTQLLYCIAGLIPPTSGRVLFDGVNAESYNPESLHNQVGLVFQDSILFNVSIRENIAFGTNIQEQDMQIAIETAEISSFIHTLPKGLDTKVSERGTSLSGGQKQRIMLARALALNPRILILDDFTARVDIETERKIVRNIEKNYPNITIISVSQKIASIEQYDHIVVMMEGEVLAQGTHSDLMKQSPEYVQIYNSQQSTTAYELHA